MSIQTTNSSAQTDPDIEPVAGASEQIEQPSEADKPKAAKGWVKSLDALRGFAALYVLMNHISVLTFMPYRFAGAGNENHIARLISACLLGFSFGHQAVIIFFVLSGFCIHYRLASGFQASRHAAKLNAGTYYLRRARRILPSYYYAIAYTALCCYLFVKINPPFAAHLTGYKFADEILTLHFGLPTLLGNLVFQQWLTCSTFGNNTPLWSLSYELWFYILYPVYVAIWRRTNTIVETVIIGFISLACGILAVHFNSPYAWPLKIGEYWIDWCIGCFAADLYVANRHLIMSKILNLWIAAGIMIAWIIGTRVLHVNDVLSDFIGAFASLFLVLTMLHQDQVADEQTQNKISRWIKRELSAVGTYSYSLYLTHVPTLALVCSVWFISHRTFPSNPLVPLLSIGLCLLVARLSFMLVERHSVSQHT